jgi:hypothetical protein
MVEQSDTLSPSLNLLLCTFKLEHSMKLVRHFSNLYSIGSITSDQIALMMVAARISKTLVNFHQTTRRYNPEDSHLRTHRRENLKSYKVHEHSAYPTVIAEGRGAQC